MIKEGKDQRRGNRLTAEYRQSMMYLFKSEISRLIELRYNKTKMKKQDEKIIFHTYKRTHVHTHTHTTIVLFVKIDPRHMNIQ